MIRPLLMMMVAVLSRMTAQEYVARQWNIEDGLPQSSIRYITQTHDGYLWLGTWNGLARFDGVRMTVFNLMNTPTLHPSITKLHEDRQHRLWIGTDGGGLCRYVNGTIVRIDSASGFTGTIVSAMGEDAAGRLWCGTDEGIFIGSDTVFRRISYARDFPDKSVTGILPRPDGSVYLELVDVVFHVRLSGDSLVVLERPFLTGGYRVDQDSSGTLWFGVNGKGLVRRSGSSEFIDNRLAGVFPEEVFVPRDQSKWIMTPKGPYVVTRHGVAHLRSIDGIDLSNTTFAFVDREGILWLAISGGGLVRLLPKQVESVTTADGLESNEVMCGMEDRHGTLWIGTWTGGLSKRIPGSGGRFSSVHPLSKSTTIISLCQSVDGALWVGTWGQGVFRIHGGRIEKIAGNGLEKYASIREIVSDPDGSVWIAGVYGALWHVKNGAIEMWSSKNGLIGSMANSLLLIRSGEVWMGTDGGGVVRSIDGRLSFLRKSNGLIDDFAHVALQDDSGAVWLTSKRGIQRWKNGTLSSVTAKQGFDDDPAQFIQDDEGNYWIGGTHGVHRILRKDLNDAADGRLATVNFLTIGRSDGMPTEECGGGNNQRVWKDRDGALWFSTTHGVARIDPRTVASNPIPPGVIIEEVQVDRRAVPMEDEIVIQPQQTSIEFRYTGINFIAPADIRFQYRLDGFDEDWREAGVERFAQYTNLAPGTYRFRVTASNNAGIRNAEGASIAVLVLPPFWATWWFRSIGIVFFLAIGPSIYLLRVRQLKTERNRQLEFSRRLIQSQESERKRIAAELHDGLGQNLLIIKNKLLVALQTLSTSTGDARQVAEASDIVTNTIEEVRSISHNLRPHQLDQLGITKTLRAIVRQVQESAPLAITAEIQEIDGLLSSEQEIGLFRIVQESFNNIIKHSGATQATLTVMRSALDIIVTIGDNGKGMPNGAPTGFGMSGMQERARMFGWAFDIRSHNGTTMELRMPAGTWNNGKREGK